MNFRDRSPNRMGSGPMDRHPGRFRQDFRGGFRGRMNDRNRNMEDRPSPWKDGDRFENKNQGGFRGGGHSHSNFNDNRDQSKDFNRDYGQNRDIGRPGVGLNSRGPSSSIDSNKWNDPIKPNPAPEIPSVPNSAPVQPIANSQRTNDVEIIVTHKTLTEYAEFIERRLKNVGLTVDLLFPNEEVPLGRVLANIASRGTLYALVVTQLSEEHRSVTVNILYGQTQEHRNMPLDDALAMIVKNFEAYMKGERCPIVPPLGAVPVTAAGIPLGEKHPEVIQTLLNILVENRPLTVAQYDKMIDYLREKRDQLLKPDLGNSIPLKPAEALSQNPKAELQSRILNMLASSDSKLNDKPGGILPPTPTPNPSLLKDATTMKALQNIVKSNLLGPLGARI